MQMIGTKRSNKKKNLQGRKKLPKLVSVLLKSKYNKARLGKRTRNVGSKLHNVKLRRKNLVLPNSVRRLRLRVSMRGNFNYSWRVSTTRILLMMKVLRILHHRTQRQLPVKNSLEKPLSRSHLHFRQLLQQQTQDYTDRIAHHHPLLLVHRHHL